MGYWLQAYAINKVPIWVQQEDDANLPLSLPTLLHSAMSITLRCAYTATLVCKSLRVWAQVP